MWVRVYVSTVYLDIVQNISENNFQTTTHNYIITIINHKLYKLLHRELKKVGVVIYCYKLQCHF